MSNTIVSEYVEELNIAVEIAKEAGKLIRSYFYREMGSSGEEFMDLIDTTTKGDNSADLVTIVDVMAEKLIVTRIKEKYPTHKIIGEEGTSSSTPSASCTNNEYLGDEWTWVIDPLDGTTNFVHRFPMVAVCISLLHFQKVVVGVVQDVCLEKTYYASLHSGAFVQPNANPEKITQLSVSTTKLIAKSIVHAEMGSDRTPEKVDNIVANLHSLIASNGKTCCHSIRSLGSAALNMVHVATGASDAYFEFGIHIWDYAAPSLIVSEAKGVLTSYTQQQSQIKLEFDLLARNVVCAATIELLNELTATILPYNQQRENPIN